MRRLCLGGTFNPVHHGHLICARSVAEAAGFDRVVLIPNQQSPHKIDATAVPAADRLAMCRLATAGDPLFEVDEIELARPGPSYTIDTARTLKSRGWPTVHWLIGGDQVPALPQWHDWRALLSEVSMVVMARPGWSLDWDTLPQPVRPLQSAVVTAPLVDVSSTDLRRRVSAGRAIRYLTPEPVVAYIAERGLYRG